MAGRDLIQRRTRSAFRDYCSDYSVVRQIERAFEDEGLDLAPGDDWYAPGQRRGTFDRATGNVDWTNPEQVRQVLNAFEEILSWGGEYAEDDRVKLRRHLERDGYTVTADGRILSKGASVVAPIPLENLSDPSAILEHLDRIGRSMDSDPPQAISAAKALVEATTKVVLTELEVEFDSKADMPALVRAAQKALKLHPDSVAPTAAGVEIVARMLSNLSQIAIGLAELRNQYGPDHGRTTAVVGLGPRHAHLAVGAASTYCRLLLETLDVRRSATMP